MDVLYPWVKSLHIIAVISWMAGMLYLPRLYVYHSTSETGSPQSETFKIMEAKLLRIIMNPAMIASWVFGLWLWFGWNLGSGGWIHAKLVLVVAMTGLHGFFAKIRKDFERDQNPMSQRFFRIINEGPTFLMILIVILAVVKPF